MGQRHSLLVAAAAFAGLTFIGAVYVRDVGRGFIKDDFAWIRDARALRADPRRALLPPTPGFYRPLVTASFAVDEARYGMSARGYGFTNLGLLVLCVAAIWGLLREAGAEWAGASVGAFAWVVNPHGINMAVVWLSGRTSLLLTLCSALAAWAFLRRQRALGALLLFAALLSKEEAIVLPIVLVVWLTALRYEGRRQFLLDLVFLSVPAIVYLVLRSQTPAMLPSTAPAFYRPTMNPRVVAANIAQYADRAGTIFFVIGLVALMAYRAMRLQLNGRLAIAAIAWILGGFALTVWLPVRSSLYAVFPSVGSALLLAALIDAARAASGDDRARDGWLAAALVSLLAFFPIYERRNDRWVEPARLSARVVQALQDDGPGPAATGIIVFEDQDREFASFRDALGSLASEAVLASIDRPFHAEVVRNGSEWRGPVAAHYKLVGGRVERVQ